MSTGGRRGAEKSSSSQYVYNESRCAGLVIIYSDELHFSAAWRPPELILGSMSTGHTVCHSVLHENSTSRVRIQSDLRYGRYIRIRIRIQM